jgi:hypothetical protein
VGKDVFFSSRRASGTENSATEATMDEIENQMRKNPRINEEKREDADFVEREKCGGFLQKKREQSVKTKKIAQVLFK